MAKGNCEFNGSGGQYFLTFLIHLSILTVVTFGIYAPWAWVKIFELKASHTTMRGREVVFTGTGGELFTLMIVQGLLTFVTLGIYAPWAICKFLSWKAENTLVGDRPSQFDGTGGSFFLFFLIHLLILPIITLGLYYLYGVYRFYAWKEENTLYGGEKTSFGGGCWDFVKISLISWILNALTLNLFMPWALAMLYRWQVEGLAVGPDASVDHFEPAKTNLAFAAALILIALVPILAFTFYAKSQYDKFMGMAQAAKMMQMSAESPQTTINLGPSLPKHSPPTTPSKSFRKESVGKATIKSDGTGFVDESRKPGSSFNKAWVCARTGDFQQAEREYTRAIQANQKDRDAYYNRGLVYVQLQEYDRACADFDAALALDPRFFEAYCNRGNVRLEAGRPELAVRDYDQAIRLNPKDGDVHFNRGVALLSLGKEAQAREGFHKAAALGQKKARAQLWAAPSRVAE